MKRSIIFIVSVVAGFAFATIFDIGLRTVGINIPATFANSWWEYSNYAVAMVLLETIVFRWAMHQVLGRRFLEWEVDDRPFLTRLRSALKRIIIIIVSVVGGYAFATMFEIGLMIVGIDIPASLATSWSEYLNYSAAMGLLLTIVFSWAMYQVLGRRFLGWKVDHRPFLERLRLSVRRPSVLGLVIAWVVAVSTVIGYPAAIYMSWRFYVLRRDAESKMCPRCAERVKAAAMGCRHCGQSFDLGATSPATPTAA